MRSARLSLALETGALELPARGSIAVYRPRVGDDLSALPRDRVVVLTGFKPRYVRWVNLTDRVEVEWFEGMTANTCMKTIATGVRTLETTNGGITVDEKGFRVLQNATLAAILASKTCHYEARG